MKRSEMKVKKKKEDIILSAIAIMNRQGTKGATMEQIAAELLMTKGSLYYYFRNKEDLIFQCHVLVLSRANEDIQQVVTSDKSYEERLREMIALHIDYAINEKETFNMIIRPDKTFAEEQLQPLFEKRAIYSRFFDEIIERGIEAGEFKQVDVRMVRMMLLGAMNWIQQWYKEDGKKSIEEIQQVYADYLIKLLK